MQCNSFVWFAIRWAETRLFFHFVKFNMKLVPRFSPTEVLWKLIIIIIVNALHCSLNCTSCKERLCQQKAKLIITRGCFSFNLIFFPFFLSPPLRSIINETRLTGFYFFFAIRRSCFKASPLLDRSSFSGPRFVISSRVKHFLSSHLKHCFKFSLWKPESHPELKLFCKLFSIKCNFKERSSSVTWHTRTL